MNHGFRGVGFSVLISVYVGDSSDYLRQALASVHQAAEGLIFQVVLVQDGPLTRDLIDVISDFRDLFGSALKVIPLSKNQGLAVALNIGLQACDHNIIARMDADDICVETRFVKQLEVMALEKHIDVLGAWVEEFDVSMSHSLGIRYTPTDSLTIRKFARRRSPISHPTVMFRKSSVQAVGGYPEFRKAQDYALWSLMLSKGYNLSNINQVLVKMRAGSGLMERRGYSYLKHELKILKFQKDIKFITFTEFVLYSTLRACLRLAPDFVKRIGYRFAR